MENARQIIRLTCVIFSDLIAIHWRFFAVAVGASVASAAFGTLGPLIFAKLIDAIINFKSEARPTLTYLITLVIVAAGSQFASTTLAAAAGWISSTRSEMLSDELRQKLMANVFHLQPDHWRIRPEDRGQILSLIDRDIEGLWDLTGFVFTEFTTSILLVFFFSSVILYMSFEIGLIFILTAAAFSFAYFQNGKRIRRHFAIAAPLFDKMLGLVNSFLDGYETIASFRKQIWAREKIGALSSSVAASANRAHLRATSFSWGTGTVRILGIAGAWLICLPGLLGDKNSIVQISLGELVAILFYFDMVANPLESIGGAARSLSKGIVSLSRLTTFFGRSSSSPLMPKKTPTFEVSKGSNKAILQLRAVQDCPIETDSVPILNPITLNVFSNELIGIAGASGSGKTTLLRIMSRMVPICSGTAELLGIPYGEIAEDEFRHQVRYVPQRSSIFPVSFLENLFFRDTVLSAEHKFEVVQQLFDSELVKRLTTEDDCIAANLSGGEAQRLSVARSIINSAKLLIVDEPTSALDFTNSQAVGRLLNDFASQRNCAVIAASHDIHVLSQCSRVCLMADGKILAWGTHDELSRTELAYKKIIRDGIEEY